MTTKYNIVVFLMMLMMGIVRAQMANDTLRVGVFTSPPFVIVQEDKDHSGLSIDLWERLATEMNVPYKYIRFSDPVEVIRSLDYGDLDIGINPYYNTPLRMERFNVSQPFHVSSVGVAITSSAQSQFQIFVKNFFSKDFLNVVLLLLVILLSFGTILWFVERRANRYQFRPGILGLFDGLWWAAVTMTTVGYGDKAPKTNAGKTIAIIWMFTAVIIISSFTATIASTLTVNSLEGQVNSLEDLKGVERVGVVGSSSGADFLQAQDIQPFQIYRSAEMALLALSHKEIEVLVHDRTTLQYLIRNRQMQSNVQLLPLTFEKQYRSFIMPKAHPQFDVINRLLVAETRSADFKELMAGYNLALD
ncbi:ion channel [Allomuricauda sp. SCSIO 65647]|uniref:ion channel n=1 Tax=Allomuricauda sp. SCSIO 65647 TaxID=2908843 RepID=UPI001F1A6C06|nr:transporter substrate-binding domain-containing protein [Muricauda sp. SCSIO 65647]UJH69149.1 transporter substrate-binding domain-containing protein [Muricauda sp. SCSIO 65647]